MTVLEKIAALEDKDRVINGLMGIIFHAEDWDHNLAGALLHSNNSRYPEDIRLAIKAITEVAECLT